MAKDMLDAICAAEAEAKNSEINAKQTAAQMAAKAKRDAAELIGSVVDGLTTIWAKSKSHVSGEPVAYFTMDRVYALVCCRKRTEGMRRYFSRR